MNILLIGSGGRENAFAWKIKQSEKCENLWIAPGNAGSSAFGQNVSIGVNDFEGIKSFCLDNKIDLLVVGPEEPLVKGLRDFMAQSPETSGIPIVGPGESGARLEGSKDFSKKFMMAHGIPTASYATFTSATLLEGIDFLKQQNLPIVLKADGLAAGKGVLICTSYEEATDSLTDMLVGQRFGEASTRVVIEAFLTGIELSVFVATDGESYKILPEAKDYKRIGEGDTGPNTGGMGAISPVPFADKDFMDKVEERVVKPTILGLKKDNIDYRGFLFIGLMNMDGEPYVIEYNVRMGDPETQAVLPRIKSDFLELLNATASKTLIDYNLEIAPIKTATVVMVAGGYPDAYEKGKAISGLEKSNTQQAITFHAGTKSDSADQIVTNGGRVLGITGLGDTVEKAIENAYLRVSEITWDKANYRKDIGQDILQLGK
ncbi:phosphoribosylamine--glycine ligase [Cyclobacterium qasimii]|uniref:Phosphoribosylamine--glycine ligase n=2 Tax=Cyclobacterium qasimii TaxID=1350429 RepID=S7WWW5_9BACT|nr:phosphoribosylamine--glycine ligase [Cyclobacterium qasimii]EPR68498.1 Phosphoribosylamine--glycine ligase [Cyclobacterium qasimii M12-11B]GEO23714.1 phosphoribosylamine--glycine ligase [Cyclobacterium qasimii]